MALGFFVTSYLYNTKVPQLPSYCQSTDLKSRISFGGKHWHSCPHIYLCGPWFQSNLWPLNHIQTDYSSQADAQPDSLFLPGHPIVSLAVALRCLSSYRVNSCGPALSVRDLTYSIVPAPWSVRVGDGTTRQYPQPRTSCLNLSSQMPRHDFDWKTQVFT